MEQDILHQTQELISGFEASKTNIDGEICLQQLQTLEKIILEDEKKAFAYVKPFVNELFDRAKKILSPNEKIKEVDLLLQQFEERRIIGDVYDELNLLKIGLNVQLHYNNKNAITMFDTLANDILIEAREIIEATDRKIQNK